MPATPPPSFTSWPPTPQRLVDAPEAYITKADPWADHLPVASAEMAAAAANVYANALQVQDVADDAEDSALSASAAAAAALGVTTRAGSSITSNTVSDGTKTFAITESGRTLHQCAAVLIGAKEDLDSFMYLVIDAGASSAGSITGTVAADGFRVGPGGAGPYTAWQIIDAFYAQQGADGADVRAATSSHLAIAPKALKEALEPHLLTDGPTVTPDGRDGLDFTWPIGGNRTLGAITNTYPGARGKIKITQDGTGGRILATASAYKRSGGLAVLSTAAGAIDYLEYDVDTVDGSGTATRIVYGLHKAPA